MCRNASHLLNSGSTPATSTPAKQLYRVRKTWADAKSQIGAYSSLENAKKACKTGYSVFDANGNVVFSNGKTPPEGAECTQDTSCKDFLQY